MNLLVTLKKNELGVEQTIQPLVRSERVSNIYIVRDHAGPHAPKVYYYCPPKIFTHSGVIRIVAKLVLMLYLVATKNPQMILGFQTFPHGINAFICGKIFRKPIIVNIMGSPKNWRGRKKLIPLLKCCDIITTTGSKSREYLVQQGFDGNKVIILPDSIDVERFHHVPLPLKYDLISVARLSSEKNLGILLKAVAMVKNKKRNIKLGLVGDGPMKDALQEMVRNLDIVNNVEFLGFRQDPEYFYNSAKIYVLTSTTEGLPMSMLEAMSCGIPCIVSNVGNISDVAIDGFNAILVEDPHDVNAFASALTRLLEDSELYMTFSQNALKVRQSYCYERATEMWEKIFSLLNVNKTEKHSV